MSRRDLNRSLVAFAVAAITGAGTATTAGAQGTPVLTWNGVVDREVRISVHGGSAVTQRLGPNEVGGARAGVNSPLPRQDGSVSVDVQMGRGEVDVIQQPMVDNDYTAIIRIRDPDAGSSRYRLTAYWRGLSGGEVVGSARGRGYGYGRWGAMRWTGHVDDDVQILLHGNNVDYRTVGGKATDDAHVNFVRGSLPAAPVQVSVTMNSGRGRVNVVQQPNADNDYTAIIEVRDRARGYGYYDFSVNWR